DEVPDVAIERAELALHVEEGACVVDGGVDLQPVADDALVGEQLTLSARVVPRDLLRVEVIERLPVRRPFAQNRDPAETRLRTLENQHLEQAPVVVQRHAPLGVVVLEIQRIVAWPGAAHDGYCAVRAVPARGPSVRSRLRYAGASPIRRTSIGIRIGPPPGPGDIDAFAAISMARASFGTSTIQKPARNSFVSANGPSVTIGSPFSPPRTMRAWLGLSSPSAATSSPEAARSLLRSCMKDTIAFTSSGFQSATPRAPAPY